MAINPDPIDGGGVGGNTASSPGPNQSWIGTVGDVSTATGNKMTTVPTVKWTARGGMVVDLTLYHNSESAFGAGSRGAKWTMLYDATMVNIGSGNVRIGWGDGRCYDFGYSGGTYSAPPGVHETLIANGSPITSYDVIKKDQTKWRFGQYGTAFYLKSISDENGNVITINRAANGGTLSIVDPTGRSVTFGYNSTYFTSITDPLGRLFQFGFDGSGNLSQVTYPIISGAYYNVNLGYDANHNVTSYQDLRGNTAHYSYNSYDNSIVWEKDNVGNQSTFSYGYDGIHQTFNKNYVTVTDPNNHLLVHIYNSVGKLYQVLDSLGDTQTLTFDSSNNRTAVQDRRGNTWNYTYDGMGNVLTAKDPLTHTITYTYNNHNKPLTIALPSNRSVVRTYDANDNLTKMQEKDALGNVKATTTAIIGSYGLVSSKTDNNSHTTQYGYDSNGYLNSVTTPGNHQTQGIYDALGFRTSRTDAMNRTTTYGPNAWEWLLTTTYPDTTTATLAYDPNGNITSFANVNGVFSRAYDIDNRMTSESFNFQPNIPTQILGHSYDATGQKGLLSTTTDVNGRVITYTYTVRNELYTVNDTAGTASYAYDANGNQTRYTAPNSLLADSYYNTDNTLDSQYDWNGGSTILASFGYSYTVDDQISSFNEGTNGNLHVTPNSTVTSYGYDGQGHLTTENRNGIAPLGQTYGVDGVGNRATLNNGVSNTFTYDTDDEAKTVTGANAFALSYNANGDRTQETFNGQLTTFGYDYDDQLTSISTPGKTLAYQYDALGRQINRTVNGVQTGLYSDGDKVLVEKGSSSSLSYTWGNGLIRSGGEYPLTDGRGNARLTTNASQQLLFSNAPDAFGISSYTPASTSAYSFRADVSYREEGAGPAGLSTAYSFQKVGARYYDPTLACFLTRDTDLSQKPYVYCNGDPVNFSDPSGHDKQWWEFWEDSNGDIDPYFLAQTYQMSAQDNHELDLQTLQIADEEVNIFGFLGTVSAIGGKVSTGAILTAPLTENNAAFGVFGGIALGGGAIKAYWAAGQALNAW